MRKLKLEVEELEVESFSVVEEKEEQGTVFARHTHEIAGCTGAEFTYDVFNPVCYSYAVECPPSYVPTNCTNSQPTNYFCDSCRDSITACE